MRGKPSLSKLVGGLIGLAFLGMAGSANASLIGDTVSCSFTNNPNASCRPPSAVVGPGSEFGVGGSRTAISIDVRDSSVFIRFLINASVSSGILNLTDLDWVGANGFITGAILASSEISGLTQGDISTTPDSLSIDLGGTIGRRGKGALIELQTKHVAVAEPATLAVFGASLIGLGLMVRRRRRAA